MEDQTQTARRVTGRRDRDNNAGNDGLNTTVDRPGPIVKCWRPPCLIPSPRRKVVEREDLDTTRAEMKCRAREHLLQGHGMLIMTVTPGAGKTTTVDEAAHEVVQLTAQTVAWFGTMHRQDSTIPRKLEPYHVWGRCQRECLEDRGGCIYGEAAQRLGSKWWWVERLLCQRCPHYAEGTQKGDCGYWRQQRANDGNVFLQVGQLWTEWWWEDAGFLIFDEVDIGDLMRSFEWNLEELGRQIEAYSEWADTLDAILRVVARTTGYLADKALYDVLDPLLQDGLTRAVPEPWEFDPPVERDVELNSDRIAWADSLPHGGLGHLLGTLASELQRYREGEEFVSRLAVHQQKLQVFPELRLPDAFWTKPAILLNATADVPAICALLEREGYPVTLYEPQVALHPNTHVSYNIHGNWAKTSLQKKCQAYRDRWIDLTREAIEQASDKALVIATKGRYGENILRVELADVLTEKQIELDHYGALGGLNLYQDCDTVVLTQVYNPDQTAAVNLYRQVWGGIEGEALDVRDCFRANVFPFDDGTGHSYEVTVWSIADERLAPIWEHLRWAEAYDALHRVRPILYPRRIIINFAVPLLCLEPTHVQYVPQKEKTMAKLQEAAQKLLDEHGFVTRQTLAQAAGVSISTASRHWPDLVYSLDLRIVEIAIPSVRYPKGRPTEAAVP